MMCVWCVGSVYTYDMRMGCLRVDQLCHHSRTPLSSCSVSHSGEFVLCNALSGPTQAPAMGADGRQGGSGSLVLLDKRRGSIVKVFRGYANESYPTECAFLTADDRYVCTGSEDGCLYVHDILSGEGVLTQACHKSHISSVSVHEAASGTANQPSTVHLCTASYDHTAKIYQVLL